MENGNVEEGQRNRTWRNEQPMIGEETLSSVRRNADLGSTEHWVIRTQYQPRDRD